MKKLLCKVLGVLFLATLVAGILAACGDAKTYKLNYAKGSIDGVTITGEAPAEASYEEGKEVTLATNPYTAVGYAFTGWSDGSKTYAAGEKFTMPAKDVTLTAQWEIIKSIVGVWTTSYTVVYDEGEPYESSMTYGCELTIAEAATGADYDYDVIMLQWMEGLEDEDYMAMYIPAEKANDGSIVIDYEEEGDFDIESESFTMVPRHITISFANGTLTMTGVEHLTGKDTVTSTNYKHLAPQLQGNGYWHGQVYDESSYSDVDIQIEVNGTSAEIVYDGYYSQAEDLTLLYVSNYVLTIVNDTVYLIIPSTVWEGQLVMINCDRGYNSLLAPGEAEFDAVRLYVQEGPYGEYYSVNARLRTLVDAAVVGESFTLPTEAQLKAAEPMISGGRTGVIRSYDSLTKWVVGDKNGPLDPEEVAGATYELENDVTYFYAVVEFGSTTKPTLVKFFDGEDEQNAIDCTTELNWVYMDEEWQVEIPKPESAWTTGKVFLGWYVLGDNPDTTEKETNYKLYLTGDKAWSYKQVGDTVALAWPWGAEGATEFKFYADIWSIEEDLAITAGTGATPKAVYPQTLKRGQALTIEGDLQYTGTADTQWDGIFVYITNAGTASTTYTDYIMPRFDAWFLNTDQTADPAVENSAGQVTNANLGFALEKTVGSTAFDWFQILCNIGGHTVGYKAEVVFYNEHLLCITYTITLKDSVSYGNPTVTATAGTQIIARYIVYNGYDALTVAIGGEDATLKQANSKVTLTAAPHDHIFNDENECLCGATRTVVGQAKTYTAEQYAKTFGWNENAEKNEHPFSRDLVATLSNNQEVVFSAVIDASNVNEAYMGLVTQIWAQSAPAYNRDNELCFQQGNNWSLAGAWSWNHHRVHAGHAFALEGSRTLNEVGTQSKAGWAYEITVRYIDGTVTIIYKAWTDGTVTPWPDYTGIATYGCVTESTLAVGWGPDGVTLEDGITVTTYNITNAD